MNPGEIEVRSPALSDGSTPLDEIVGQGVNIHWVQIRGKDKTVTVVFHTRRRASIIATLNEAEPVCLEAVDTQLAQE